MIYPVDFISLENDEKDIIVSFAIPDDDTGIKSLIFSLKRLALLKDLRTHVFRLLCLRILGMLRKILKII